MIAGRATPEGTARFVERFADTAAAGHFRRFGDLWLSSIGLGTYLGEPDDATDAGYESAVAEALAAGCNVFDTAINYRHQRSERALGRAVARAIEEDLAARDEVFVATKGGFLPFDGDLPSDPPGWLRATYLDSGLVAPDDLAAGCHALTPAYLADQLARSRANLGLETLDLYYLHNPETQRQRRPPAGLTALLRAAFDWLEGRVSGGEVGCYGLATWNAHRVPAGSPDAVSLAEVLAEGRPDGLRAVQLPLNLAMPEALAKATQEIEGVVVPAAIAARHFDLALFTSASILQGRLAGGLHEAIHEAFPGLETDAQRALQFTRSAPGVTTALVGMSRPEHVRENLALAAVPPAEAETFRKLFGGGEP